MLFHKRLRRRNGCAIIVALLAALLTGFVIAAMIGSHRLYEQEECFDRNLTGKPISDDEVKKLVERCTRDPQYRRAISN
jgi:hypothetical protein